MDRRAFLRQLAGGEHPAETQTLTRRQFNLVAFITALILAFLPLADARKLIAALFGEPEKTQSTLTSFDAALKKYYTSDRVGRLFDAPGWLRITAIDREAGTITAVTADTGAILQAPTSAFDVGQELRVSTRDG